MKLKGSFHQQAACTGRKVWQGIELRDSPSWIFPFSALVIRELELFSRDVNTSRYDLVAADMPCTLGSAATSWLRTIHQELHLGRGFAVLRGLPIARYSDSELSALFMAIGMHLGAIQPQDLSGNSISRIEDVSAPLSSGQRARGYMTNALLQPHTDASDLVALLCVRNAKRGGLSTIASAMAIYNEILWKHPEHLSTLHRGFYEFNVLSGNSATTISPRRVPVFFRDRETFRCTFHPGAIHKAATVRGKPLASNEQAALDCVSSTATQPDLRLDMRLEPGDIQLLDNYSVLHARTRFEDFDDTRRKRLLLRLWISTASGYKAPINNLTRQNDN